MEDVSPPASGVCPLLRRSSIKRSFSTMSDREESASSDTLFVPQDHDNQPPTRPQTHSHLALPRRRPHRIGDDLDSRRTTMSGEGGTNGATSENGHMLIDLTEDDDVDSTTVQATSVSPRTATENPARAQRPPRFGRNIIAVESEGEENSTEPTSSRQANTSLWLERESHIPINRDSNAHFSSLPRPPRPTSSTNMDEVEFIEERHLPVPQALAHSLRNTNSQRSATPYPTRPRDTIDLTEDDDEVEYLNTRTRHRPEVTAGVGTRSDTDRTNRLLELLHGSRDRLQQRFLFSDQGEDVPQAAAFQRFHGNYLDFRGFHVLPPDRGETNSRSAHLAGRLGPVAIAMDYGAIGFDMGPPGTIRPPTPKYEPPEPPAAGFTRNPGEDETVVCPNCGDELAMGDTEVKQEVWVIKKCGHAYCGDCAKNRPRCSKGTKASKGKGKAPATTGLLPFKSCVVDGCKELASIKSMVHVYIGS